MAAKVLNEIPSEEVVVVTADVTTKVVKEKELPLLPMTESDPDAVAQKPLMVEKPAEEENLKETKKDEKISQVVSFKEESYVAEELPEEQRKALEELKELVRVALEKNDFTAPPTPAKEEVKVEIKDEKNIEGVKSKGDAAEVMMEATELAKEEVIMAEESIAAVGETVAETGAVIEEESGRKIVDMAITEVAEKVNVEASGEETVEDIKETIVEVTSVVTPPPLPEANAKEEAAAKEPEEVRIWGIPLLKDERNDVVLLKFLRARDFNVKDSFEMLKSVVTWRKDVGVDSFADESLRSSLEKSVFMHGVDRKGRPVCYNVFGVFQDKELYANTFGDEEKRKTFLKWRVNFFEKSIGLLDMSPRGVSTFFQVIDIKNSPGLRKEIRLTNHKMLQLLQDNYPEFVAKQVIINVPWWYLAYAKIINPFLTKRTKSKILLAGPSRTAYVLFKYIAPEQVPVQYGGLSRDGEQVFTTADTATEVAIKPLNKHTVEFPASEKCTIVWEARVLGPNAMYGAQFVPDSEESYTVIVHKSREIITSADEPIIAGCFKAGEPGKVMLTVDNQSSKKMKLLYRSKIKTNF